MDDIKSKFDFTKRNRRNNPKKGDGDDIIKVNSTTGAEQLEALGLESNFSYPCPDARGTAKIESACKFDCRNVTKVKKVPNVEYVCSWVKKCREKRHIADDGGEFLDSVRVKRHFQFFNAKPKKKEEEDKKKKEEDIKEKMDKKKEDGKKMEKKLTKKACTERFICQNMEKFRKVFEEVQVCDRTCSVSRVLDCRDGMPKIIQKHITQYNYNK